MHVNTNNYILLASPICNTKLSSHRSIISIPDKLITVLVSDIWQGQISLVNSCHLLKAGVYYGRIQPLSLLKGGHVFRIDII